MGFKYVEYDTLSKYIRESIATELKSHDLDEKNLPKALKDLSVSHPKRAIQCKYLLKVLACLDKYGDQKKAEKECVLNAAAFYIRAEIFQSYQGTITSFFLSPENSTLYNALTTSLNLNMDNFPDSKDLFEMYKALSVFMNAHVFVDANPVKGYLDSEKQAFSTKRIRGYKVEVVLQDLVGKIAKLELEQIEKAKEQQLKNTNRLGLFSSAPIIPTTESPAESNVNESISIQCI